jgi:chromosomal replication initiator protein
MRQWESFLQEQEAVFGKKTIEQWIKPLKVVDFDAANLYLEGSDTFQLRWFEEHFRPQIQQYFRNKNGKPIKVHLSSPETILKKKKWIPVLNLEPDDIIKSHNFENFFSGKTNSLNLTLLRTAIEKKEFNPIYVQGPKESGKTHLLMSCAQYCKENCFYVTADTLTNHVVAAIRSGEMKKLRQIYRSKEMLLIDDIDKLMDRSATQEEFFHTFNALYGTGKQIIIAGPVAPTKLQGIEPRLTSRFEWGLILPFQPLNVQERKSLVQAFAPTIPEEIQNFIAKELSSIKLLQSAIDIILANKINSLTIGQKAIEVLLEEQRKKIISSEKIVEIVAQFFEICTSDVLGRSQAQECSLPRHIVMYICRAYLYLSFVKIGKIFSRDHSTVMACVKNIEKKIAEQNTAVTSCLNEIKAKLKF